MSKLISIIVLAVFCGIGCRSEYDKKVREEMDRGMVQDSLLFDMRIGQTRKDFFDRCWKLNKEQLLSQGTGNTTARYIEPKNSGTDSLKLKDMLFYGIFDNQDTMRGMDMTYSYLSWAPWNEDKHSDKLIEDLKQSIMRDYGGNPFMEIPIDNKSKSIAYAKIDGRTQILMYAKNKKDVYVAIEDLKFKLKGKQ